VAYPLLETKSPPSANANDETLSTLKGHTSLYWSQFIKGHKLW